MAGFKVIHPGILSLLQDAGRYGWHGIGVTTGGPMDRQAFRWANRLCGNDDSGSHNNSSAIEVTVGGLVLEAEGNSNLAVTGADIPLTINKQPAALWQTHRVKSGDRIELGYATQGSRNYLAVTGGFQAEAIFDSQATVPREGLGGLHQNGQALQVDDHLPCPESGQQAPLLRVPEKLRPENNGSILLRVILGYQQHAFTEIQKQLFFSSEYTLTQSCDRMGYRLSGAQISPSIHGILSEGICLGAIQVPADGQPIILLRDRQTIGGYPKLGSVLSLDLDRLAQLVPGDTLRFEPISIDQAHNALLLAEQKFAAARLETVHV